MRAAYITFKFSISHIKEEKGENNFNNLFNQYIQNIIISRVINIEILMKYGLFFSQEIIDIALYYKN